jgi:hypothetical protein
MRISSIEHCGVSIFYSISDQHVDIFCGPILLLGGNILIVFCMKITYMFGLWITVHLNVYTYERMHLVIIHWNKIQSRFSPGTWAPLLCHLAIQIQFLLSFWNSARRALFYYRDVMQCYLQVLVGEMYTIYVIIEIKSDRMFICKKSLTGCYKENLFLLSDYRFFYSVKCITNCYRSRRSLYIMVQSLVNHSHK